MFEGQDLQDHLETSSTISSRAAVIAEWNLNVAENISRIGNYRFRPSAIADPNSPIDQLFSRPMATYDPDDANKAVQYYTGATDADVLIDGGLDSDGITPIAFATPNEKDYMLYSLEDCFKRFRPRSGINKLRYFGSKYTHYSNVDMAERPRYYAADKDDKFKYWSSVRSRSVYRYDYSDGRASTYGENPKFVDSDGVTKNGSAAFNAEHGISRGFNGQNFIDDACPFVVYKNSVPANRVVVKMQTNVGTIDLGPFYNEYEAFDDPMYGYNNSTVPIKWKIEVLIDNTWTNAITFDPTSLRKDGSPVVGPDGYVEIAYGLKLPKQFANRFVVSGEYSSRLALPVIAETGDAYLVKESDTSIGVFYVWTGTSYESFVPEYGWFLYEEDITNQIGFVTSLVNADTYIPVNSALPSYREFQYISGVRVVVETMNVEEASFDLIELSPRLSADISDKTMDYGVTKIASDLGLSGLPVGQLLASTGSLTVFDYDDAFNESNTNSIVADYVTKNIQIKFYEVISNVSGTDYYVPIKSMYADGFPEFEKSTRQMSLQLRDMFFYLESTTAPQMLVQNVSLSYAISMLLDSIGFSNYTFKRLPGESETIIPYFFIPPDTSVAQILQDLAVSTQTVMFFDEYNNFVMMSKNYMMPSETDRPTNTTFYGTKDFQVSGGIKNETTNTKLANILGISSVKNDVFNDGTLTYSTRYIQKSYGSIRQSSFTDREKTWIYKPVLLWEASGTENLRSRNDDAGVQSTYSLAAIPLNTTLSSNVPTVSQNQLIDNTMDLGDGVYWLTRYKGYFYSNGEIIKYDAVEYNVSGIGNTWIQSSQEYNSYFSKVPFNGKIYPTGLVRIFAEPNYELIDGETRLKNGAVAKHGRGQFGTTVVSHQAGLAEYWSDTSSTAPVRGCFMDSKYLFSTNTNFILSNVESTTAGVQANDAIFAPDASKVMPGYSVKIFSGRGVLQTDTKVKEVYLTPAEKNAANEPYKKYTIVLTKPATEAIVRTDSLGQVYLNKIQIIDEVETGSGTSGKAGIDNATASKSQRVGIIKNFMSNSSIKESDIGTTVKPGTIQSSALVFTGPNFTSVDQKPTDFISYLYKPLDNKFIHFGTRMRIVGRLGGQDNTQSPIGASEYYAALAAGDGSSVSLNGGSGGLGILVDPTTNNGYYLEIITLTETNLSNYSAGTDIHNIIFYKVVRSATDGTTNETKAIPIKLWGGLSQFVVDDGKLTGQGQVMGEQNPSVYDLAVEYERVGSDPNKNSKRFYIYLNNKLVATVDDNDALPDNNNNHMALFVRGNAKCMFENLYAMTNNYSQTTVAKLDSPVSSVFGDEDITINESFRKYAMSGLIQATYLKGISANDTPKFQLYFEEFGTIMREAANFDIRYDKAYPAIYAKLSPTFNYMKGYTVSGFRAGSYGAQFMIFNNTDTILNLDETTGNYLRIQGVTFTQQSQNNLTVDDYFSKRSDYSKVEYSESTDISNVLAVKEEYQDIKNSRLTYGRNEFALNVPYIQDADGANDLMGWIISKIMKPRKSIGVNLFAMPTLQLGDIVKVDYTSNDGIEQVSLNDSRFVVYNIDWNRGPQGPSMTVYLSEVV
jgi:hypothetical protein